MLNLLLISFIYTLIYSFLIVARNCLLISILLAEHKPINAYFIELKKTYFDVILKRRTVAQNKHNIVGMSCQSLSYESCLMQHLLAASDFPICYNSQ